MEKEIPNLLKIFDLKITNQIILYQNKQISDRIKDRPYNIIHEIAHFQVSSRNRRNIRNFGLGATAYEKLHEYFCDSSLTDDEIFKEEARATLLTLFWYQKLDIYEKWPFYDEPLEIRANTIKYTIPLHHIPEIIEDEFFSYEKNDKYFCYKKGTETLTLDAFEWLLDHNLLDHNFRPTHNLYSDDDTQ